MGAALNDLAYAVNDTIKDPANFKALNVLIQEMINNAVSQALNNTFGTEGASPLNVLIGNGNTEIKDLVTAFQTAMKSGGVPIVRKIQRGIVSMNSTVDVTLSGFTNLDKMIVIVQGSGSYGAWSNTNYPYAYSTSHYLSALTRTKLTLAGRSGDGNGSYLKASYQVIEFW